ncbi:hypothetical protein [Planctomyces sp. SH-PL62]|uniref:hypothetical protein n=1 Tax=Planctomyces sp. SH-PL62 TaxID=1636152 RepID=UPI00078D0D17|nr:hypothetical protein [Planctomyces sp. SH-PL62]AMV40799.1 hypothetical protein VT85_25425 [Planctomyces sp. SH-PL62]
MNRITLSSPRANLAIAALSSFLTILATVALQGCGGETPVFDQSLQHTPETLVQEFLVRYKNLPENRKALKASRSAKSATAKGEQPDVDEAGKSSRKEAAVKGQMVKESETLENVVATLEDRLGTVQGVPRAEAAKKAVELIENQSDLKAEDKQAVIERLKKLD